MLGFPLVLFWFFLKQKYIAKFEIKVFPPLIFLPRSVCVDGLDDERMVTEL
jgi:hypothetical protein